MDQIQNHVVKWAMVGIGFEDIPKYTINVSNGRNGRKKSRRKNSSSNNNSTRQYGRTYNDYQSSSSNDSL